MVLATRRADAERRPRRMVHTTLLVLASALLVSIPRSDALLALPPAALPPAAIAAAATAAGRGGHHHGRRCVVSATTSSTFVGMMRQRPASWRCAAPGPVCSSSSSSSEGRCRRSRSGLLVMSGVGGEEGGEGEGLTEGEELGVVVEGVRRSPLSSSAIEESGSGEQQRPGGAVTTRLVCITCMSVCVSIIYQVYIYHDDTAAHAAQNFYLSFKKGSIEVTHQTTFLSASMLQHRWGSVFRSPPLALYTST